MKCKNCGHNGNMHSDGDYTHTGGCFTKLENGSFCDCEKFIPSEDSDKNLKNFVKCPNGCHPIKLFEIEENQFHCKECNEVFIKSEKKVGCGKVFETDLIHKNGTKDKLVCRCGGEDGLCEKCSKLEKAEVTNEI